jgi:hypothetical protein
MTWNRRLVSISLTIYPQPLEQIIFVNTADLGYANPFLQYTESEQ